VSRKGSFDSQPHTVSNLIVIQEPAREVGRPIGVLTTDLHALRPARGEEERGFRRSRPDTAEPSTRSSTEIENPEMKARRRLDEDDALAKAGLHDRTGSWGAERM
jgi:hypothetical protein